MEEWYLMTPSTRPNLTGGFEGEAFSDYKEDAFAEALQTDIASTVTLCNHDLSESREIRCVIQGNTANTQLNSMQRQVLFEIGTAKAGMYLYFENRYWLIVGYPGNNGIYEKAVVYLCHYLLRWQNTTGKIIERWIYSSSASKYDVGEQAGKTAILASNNFIIFTPNDIECQELEGKRVFIDIRKIKPTKVYKVTRNDDVLAEYGEHGSFLSFIVDRTELNLSTDNQELRIADYSPTPQFPVEGEDITYSITGDDELWISTENQYTAEIITDEQNVSFISYTWDVQANDSVIWNVDDNVLTISCKDRKSIGQKVIINLLIDGEIKASKEVLITNFI